LRSGTWPRLIDDVAFAATNKHPVATWVVIRRLVFAGGRARAQAVQHEQARNRVMTNTAVKIEGISAVTFFITDMARAVRFYEALGFETIHGGASAPFTSFRAGSGYINVAAGRVPKTLWGRVIVYVSDVDAMYARACAAGFSPEMAPSDAAWGERYFHLRDPDGNELSFARPLA